MRLANGIVLDKDTTFGELKLKLSYFLHEDYGFYSYSEHYALGDIFVLCSHELDKGVLVELKGRGCRQFESYLLAQQRSWYTYQWGLAIQLWQYVLCATGNAVSCHNRV